MAGGDKIPVRNKRLLLVLCKVPPILMEVLGVTRPQDPTTQVVEVDEKGIVGLQTWFLNEGLQRFVT